MTGTQLLEALSFVDEKYIQEAENARLSNRIPWMKVLSVAACLCILIAGAFALENFGHKGATEEAAAPAAPMEAPAATEAAPRQESAQEESGDEAAAEAAAGELHHVAFAHLRVVKILEGVGFEAIVEADEPMEMDTQVTVVIDPSKVPGADREITNDLSGITEGMMLKIYDGAYDAGQNTLYVSHVLIVEE